MFLEVEGRALKDFIDKRIGFLLVPGVDGQECNECDDQVGSRVIFLFKKVSFGEPF